jgi:putative ABC transport system permease protein
VSVSVTENLPGHSYDDRFLYPENPALGEQYNFSLLVADHDYAETIGLEMSQGRTFARELATDSNAVVVNEAAVKILGLNDPIGKRVGLSIDNTFPIIGVIKDFHFESLHANIKPLVYFLGRGTMRFAAIRIRSDDISRTLGYLKERWLEFVPDVPFKYSFLDEDFAALYRTEQKSQQLFSTFSVLAILIASIGLFGLAAFTAERRTKEIGVRKVMGASNSNLIFLLNKEFFKIVVVANVIAWPIAYYSMTKWLQDFAYRIDISWWIFAMAGGLALMIALLTVSAQAIRAAVANPVDSLRYE